MPRLNTKHFRLLAGLLSAAMLLLGTAALTEAAPRRGGVLRVAATASPPTLDPHAVTHIATREVGLHIFEQLVTFDENFRIIPQLAESWEVSDDGLRYTFHLRQGVLFHNGQEMTAEDVKASIERFQQVSARRQELANLERVEVVDRYTVVLHTKQPSGAFLAALASPIAQLAIMPKDVVTGAKAQEVELIGTGPYRFVEWIPDRHIRIARFEQYKPQDLPASGLGGRREAYLDEIHFIPVPEPGARVAGLETGEYHFADMLPAHAVSRLASTPGLEVVQLSPYTWVAVYFNHTGIFSDLRMRRAVQAALNMEEIAIIGGEGAGRLDPGFYFQEQMWHSTAGAEWYDQRDPEKARQLLAEAGYQGQPITLITNTSYDYMYKSALAIHQQLARAGFNVKMEVYDWPGALAVRADMDRWDLFISSHSTRFDPTANDFYFLPETSFFGYNNPQATELIRKAGAEQSPETRYALYEELQRLLYEDAAWLKLFDLNVFQGYQSNVKGLKAWVLPHFWNVWLE